MAVPRRPVLCFGSGLHTSQQVPWFLPITKFLSTTSPAPSTLSACRLCAFGICEWSRQLPVLPELERPGQVLQVIGQMIRWSVSNCRGCSGMNRQGRVGGGCTMCRCEHLGKLPEEEVTCHMQTDSPCGRLTIASVMPAATLTGWDPSRSGVIAVSTQRLRSLGQTTEQISMSGFLITSSIDWRKNHWCRFASMSYHYEAPRTTCTLRAVACAGTAPCSKDDQ